MTIEDQDTGEGAAPGEKPEQRLVRLIKSVVENPERGTSIDGNTVRFQYFNSFNYSMLAREGKSVNLTVGITSANRGEGKTLVAANLAVSIAMGFRKKTILVDLCFASPRVHEIFGLQNGPGLAESFTNGAIHVSRTQVENLYVLSSGIIPLFHEPEAAPGAGAAASVSPKPLLGLDQLTAFRDVIYSLEQEFDFVIVDMPAVNTAEIPILFTNQLNGLLIVLDSGKTRREDLDAMFQKVNDHQVLGFVFNRVRDTN
jgi:Mrp family chromosome partitioning ATPase